MAVTNDGPYVVYNATIVASPSYPFDGYISPVYVSSWAPGQSVTLTGYLDISPSASPGVYRIPVYVYVNGFPSPGYQTFAPIAINGYADVEVQYASLSSSTLKISLVNSGNVQSGSVKVYFYNTSLLGFPLPYYVVPQVAPGQTTQVSVPVTVKAPLAPGVYFVPMRLEYMGASHEVKAPVVVPSDSAVVYSLTGKWEGSYASLTLIYSSPYNVTAVRLYAELPQGLKNSTGGSLVSVTLPLTSQSGAVKFNVYLKAEPSVYTVPVKLVWFTDKGVLTEGGYLTLYVYQAPKVEVLSVEGVVFAGSLNNLTVTVRNSGDAPAYNVTAHLSSLPVVSRTVLPYLPPGGEGKVYLTVYAPFDLAGQSTRANLTVYYTTSQGTVGTASVPITLSVYQPPVPIVVSDPNDQVVAGIDNTVTISVANNFGFPLYDVVVNATPSVGSVIGQGQYFLKSMPPNGNASFPFVISVPSYASGTLSLKVTVSYITPFGTKGVYSTAINYKVLSMGDVAQKFEIGVSPSAVQYGNLTKVTVTLTSFFDTPISGAIIEVSSPNGYVSPSTVPVPTLAPLKPVSVSVNVLFPPPTNGSPILEPLKVTVKFYYGGSFLNFTKTLKVLAVGKPVLIVSGVSYAVVKGNSSKVTAGLSFLVGNTGSGAVPSVTIVPLPPPGIDLIAPSVVGISNLQPSQSQAVSFTVVGKPGNYTVPLRIIYTTPLGQTVTEVYNVTLSLAPPATAAPKPSAPSILYDPLLPVVVALAVAVIVLLWKVRGK